MLNEIPPKRVDESWKEEVARERRQLRRERGQNAETSTTDLGATAFTQFLLGLRLQALIALGQVPHPLTQQLESQPEQAQYVIETLAMLQIKTRGNLTPDESTLLDEMLYELRMKFVELTQPPSPPGSTQHA